LIFLVLITLGAGRPVRAQSDVYNAWQAANDVREALFGAQTALLGGKTAEAIALTKQADSTYRTLLRPVMAAAPEIVASLDRDFAAIAASAAAGDSVGFAARRGYLWVGMLRGSASLALKSLENGQGTTASLWLLLREFHPTTIISRPYINATRAVNALIKDEQSAPETLPIVRADLIDTYQAWLDESLTDADLAGTRGFAIKRAEEAGLAAGYFEILVDAYAAQHDANAATSLRGVFEKLLKAASTSNDADYKAARQQIDAALKGFVAAPLLEPEQAPRAGQMLRLVALAPLEYSRGVSGGKVTDEDEVQEALTALSNARIAFTELKAFLQSRNKAATDSIEQMIGQLEAQMRATAEPITVEMGSGDIIEMALKLLPPEWYVITNAGDINAIRDVLSTVRTTVAQGLYNEATAVCEKAYAALEAGLEQRLLGFAPEIALRLDKLLWEGEPDQPGLAALLAVQAPVEKVVAVLDKLDVALADAELVLISKTAPASVVGNVATIVFREGLEAILILASLLASLRALETRRLRRPILVGAGLAFVAAVVTWWIAYRVLLPFVGFGARLEAVVSLASIGVMLVITNWFFHRFYWTGWIANFHAQKTGLLHGQNVQWIGLLVLGFASVYREGFETALFLQSPVLSAGVGVALQGVLIGMVAVSVVGVLIFVLEVRLPYRKMLIVTGVLIGMVLVITVGNTVHTMQVVGWLPVTPITSLNVPYWMGQWFGVFATWQGIALQIGTATVLLGSYAVAEYLSQRRRSQAQSAAAHMTQ
jgi:high-affinity iron transporter